VALVSIGAKAQVIDTTDKHKGYFHYMYENDLFTGTDRYYTQGSIVEFMHPVLKRSPLSKLLLRVVHLQQEENFISFRQDVFTPKSIRNKMLDSTDRPYAGTFFFSQKVISRRHHATLTTSLDLGCIGPSALGEQMQKFIHAHTNNAEPIGWENQVANSFIANYNLWYEYNIGGLKWINLAAEAGGKAGILYTNASAGLTLRIGKMRQHFVVYKPRPIPKWELYGTIGGNATYVYHNAVIQGVPWSKSVHVLSADKIERIVYKLNAAITFSFKRISLIYTSSFISPEIKGGLPHGWGGINFVYRF
jgi:lipid A 3-O-deacylase